MKLLFTDTFAGKGIDTGTAIARDPSGNVYIAGTKG
jgi:beta-propeller repeat-containing protein